MWCNLKINAMSTAVKEVKKSKFFESNEISQIPVGDVAPEGYITGKEFRKRAIQKVNTFCDKHGIL